MAQQTVPAADSGRFDVIPYTDLSPESTWTRLGRGSFGCVFKGLYLGLEVAIKEVLNSDEYDVDKYFKRECTLMKECRHPNIVQFIGLSLAPPPPPDYLPPLSFDSNGTAVDNGNATVRTQPPARRRILIISEFLPNGNLRSHILNKKLDFSWRLRLSFSVDIVRALAYLHARKCMHRDLKGENLLIAENDRIKVCDFGFARIAARNDEEMRRMSYCGTDGYMSPEILIGDEFGIETDIFSLGVILCEISSRRLVDDYTYKRLMPSFGLDPDEIRELASPDCPPAFVELAIACVAEEPSHRPTIRAVLERLMVIERGIIESQASEGYNVGSLTYSAKHAGRQTKSSKLKRPQPGRIPSFQGQVKPSYSATGAVEGGDSSSDEDVHETLAKLEKLRVGGKGSVYLTPKGAEATSRLLDIVDDDKSSTYAVIKGSKMSTRSSFLQRDKEDTSSVITVKGQANLSAFSTGSSLPSLPASWIQAANEAIEKREQEAKAKAEEIVEPEPKTSATLETSHDSASTSSEDLPITPEPEAAQVTAEPEAITPIAIMPGSLPESKFDTIKSLSTPVAVTPEFLDTTLSDIAAGRPGPHRFTLIKPGWKALWESHTPHDKGHNKRQSRSGDVSGRSSMDSNAPRKSFDGDREKVAYTGGLAAMLPVHLLSVGLLTKCQMCEKRLGLMKPYLACDDCQRVYHVRCGDTVSANCGGYHTPAASQHEMSALPKDVKDRGKKQKRESRKLSRVSPASSVIAL